MIDINLNEQYSGATAPEVITQKYNGRNIKYVPYNIINNDGLYTWNYTLVKQNNYNYEGLVDNIIGIKYTLRSMLAILNNYIADPKNEEYKQEFDDMQEWRSYAKSFSKQHFGI
jgi:hypothetical protein